MLILGINVRTFTLQQQALACRAARIAHQHTARARHAVAGNDDADGIVPHSPAYGTRRTTQRRRQFTIAAGPTIRDFRQRTPHPLSKRRPPRCQRQNRRARSHPRPIRLQPRRSLRQHTARLPTGRQGIIGLPEKALPLHPQPDQSPTLCRQAENTHGRINTATTHHAPFSPIFRASASPFFCAPCATPFQTIENQRRIILHIFF